MQRPRTGLQATSARGMSASPCLDCGEPTRAGSRCADCAPRHRLGWAWSATRTTWLAGHPSCAGCGAMATEVDHVVPRARGGGHDGNLQSLCHRCHAAKTAREAAVSRLSWRQDRP